MKSVAVIGAGFSGLVSSLLLSQLDMDVVLIERDAKVAPLLRNNTYDGHEVNNAFHYLGGYYPGSALYRSFEQMGLNDELSPISFKETGPDCFLGVAASDLFVPVGLKRVKSVFSSTFPDNESALNEYFDLMEELFQNFSFTNLKMFFSETAPKLSNVSLRQFFNERKTTKDLTEFLGGYSEILLGVNADEVPLLNHILGVGAYFLSANTFQGGGGAIVTALERKVREAGVQILTDSEVVGLDCDNHRMYKGLKIRSAKKGQEFTLNTDACISTVHPRRLLELLPDGFPSTLYSRRISNYSNTKSVCLFHLDLDQKITRRYELNYHLFHRERNGSLIHQLTVMPNYRNLDGRNEKGQELSVVRMAWENEAGKGCPGQKHNSINRANTVDKVCRQSKPRLLEKIRYNMVSKLEDTFPELSGKYRIIQTLSPCDFDRINRSWNGSAYGVKCSVDRFDFTTLGPLRKLFLAGQSVIGPGIYGTLISSYLAVERLVR